MKTIAQILLLSALCGCSYRKLEIPYKVGGTNTVARYTSSRLGNNETLKRVEFRGPNGETFILEGWAGNQADSMGIVAEGAARGAVGAFTGQYKLLPKNDASIPQPEIP